MQVRYYVCNDKGHPAQDGEKKGKMLQYTHCDELEEVLFILKGKIRSRDIVDAIIANERSEAYMIDRRIFITASTWSYIVNAIDAHDRNEFEVVDEETYALWDEDAVFSKKSWRGDE